METSADAQMTQGDDDSVRAKALETRELLRNGGDPDPSIFDTVAMLKQWMKTEGKTAADVRDLVDEIQSLMDPPAGPELKELEQKVSAAMDKDPYTPEGSTKRAEAYYILEKFRAKYANQIVVSSFLTKRRRLLRGKDKKENVAALDADHPNVANDIHRLNELRQRLALARPHRGFLAAVKAFARNVAVFVWVVCAIPMCFTAVVLRVTHPPLRSIGVRNGQLPLDLFQMHLCRVVLSILGVRVRYHGLKRIKSLRENGTGTIGMFSHTCNLDPFIVSAGPLAFKWVGKRELFLVPILGWMVFLYGHIPIDRKNLKKAKDAINQTVVGKIKKWNRSIAISPEGTRSRSGRLADFKRGPFHLAKNVHLPITPIHIEGAWVLNPPGTKLIYPGTVDLEFLPSENVEKGDSVDVLSHRVRDVLLESTNPARNFSSLGKMDSTQDSKNGSESSKTLSLAQLECDSETGWGHKTVAFAILPFLNLGFLYFLKKKLI